MACASTLAAGDGGRAGRASSPKAKVLLAAYSLAAQPAILLYLGWRQVGYLRLREVEPNAVVNPGHGTDGDGDLLLAP